MNKFGLLDPEELPAGEEGDISQRLAAFPLVKPRSPIDLPAVDAAAAQHGFTSREASPVPFGLEGRRRRAIPAEATRHLAIRLPVSAYARFVAYADLHRLTYHDALIRLMDEASVATTPPAETVAESG